jgi:hypothetical protein
MKQDFKLEWFVPDDSYIQNFMAMNTEQFARGQRVSIYTREMDDFAMQRQLHKLSEYMRTSKYVDQDEDVSSWVDEFRTFTKDSPTWSTNLNADGDFKTRESFYEALREFTTGGGGARYRSSLKWMDSACDDGDEKVACDPQQGLKSTRLNCVLKLEHTMEGTSRYNTMVGMREDVNAIVPLGSDGNSLAFPFDFQFLYWEEVGIVGSELWRNLAIASVVIVAIIFMLIPRPRIALFVAGGIVVSMAETVGFCHFWGVSISGVSSIYILICVGLAVDYSAHVAHMFKEAVGDAQTRAVEALERIGPAVLNAIVSTGLAVVVLGFSKSYTFRTFFQVLFLVLIFAGANGLWLLPVILATFGGNQEAGSHHASGPTSPTNKVADSKRDDKAAGA